MNLVQALDIANDCSRAKNLMGMNAVFPYTQNQFVDAILTLQGQIETQLTKIKSLEAQLRASNARAIKNG